MTHLSQADFVALLAPTTEIACDFNEFLRPYLAFRGFLSAGSFSSVLLGTSRAFHELFSGCLQEVFRGCGTRVVFREKMGQVGRQALSSWREARGRGSRGACLCGWPQDAQRKLGGPNDSKSE